MIAKNPEERRYYESRLKMQRDEQARLEAAEERGEARGRAEGEAHGLAIGRVKLLEQLSGLPESSADVRGASRSRIRVRGVGA